VLADLLDAIVADGAEAVRIVRDAPELARSLVEDERFVESIAHALYAGDTALHVAAAAVNPVVVEAVLRAGADPGAENRRGAIALHYACDPRPLSASAWSPAAQRRVIELLVDAGSRIDHAEKAGATPLHRAVRARSPEAVRCLIERGADVNASHGKQRTTPLHLALHSTGATGTRGAHAEQDEIIALLLDGGADPRARDAHGRAPPLARGKSRSARRSAPSQ
jgi:ankyrin repeat protein